MKEIFEHAGKSCAVISSGAVAPGAPGTVPTEWRLLAYGEMEYLDYDGKHLQGQFTPEHAAIIAGNFERRGALIPIDCEHVLYALACAANVDERELVAMTGKESLAAGFCGISCRRDGLYVCDAKWTPIGAEIVKSGAYRYDSPVIRNLGRPEAMEISSVALTNNPAILQIDAIAASAAGQISTTMEDAMDEEKDKTPGAAACAAADPAENPPKEAQTSVAAAASPEPSGGKAQIAPEELRAKLAMVLGVDPASDPAALLAAVEGVVMRLRELEDNASMMQEVAASADTALKKRLIDEGIANHKLSNGMRSWAEAQSVPGLKTFLAVAAPVVPAGCLVAGAAPAPAAGLTGQDKQICRELGISESEYLKNR